MEGWQMAAAAAAAAAGARRSVVSQLGASSFYKTCVRSSTAAGMGPARSIGAPAEAAQLTAYGVLRAPSPKSGMPSVRAPAAAAGVRLFTSMARTFPKMKIPVKTPIRMLCDKSGEEKAMDKALEFAKNVNDVFRAGCSSMNVEDVKKLEQRLVSLESQVKVYTETGGILFAALLAFVLFVPGMILNAKYDLYEATEDMKKIEKRVEQLEKDVKKLLSDNEALPNPDNKDLKAEAPRSPDPSEAKEVICQDPLEDGP